MADFAIGDIQGCYDPLMRLLDKVNFNERADRLWCVGDLVNRGTQSLAVLRFMHKLPLKPRITLGNHDLHLLAKLFGSHAWQNADDTLADILAASDGEELGHWLRKQSILYHDTRLNVVMCHAGIAPFWDLAEASQYARELETVLAGEHDREFLTHMYGNEPACWSSDLTGISRLRVITNYFTRMRFCDAQGCLVLGYKGSLASAPARFYPWYAVPGRKIIEAHLVFGHWAALEGKSPSPTIHALDTGCLWGGELTALRLQDQQRFAVASGNSNYSL